MIIYAVESCATFDASEAGVFQMCCAASPLTCGAAEMRLFSRARRAARKGK